jgi:hypothetical protein
MRLKAVVKPPEARCSSPEARASSRALREERRERLPRRRRQRVFCGVRLRLGDQHRRALLLLRRLLERLPLERLLLERLLGRLLGRCACCRDSMSASAPLASATRGAPICPPSGLAVTPHSVPPREPSRVVALLEKCSHGRAQHIVALQVEF